jgi:hypothetical protein
MKILHVLTGGLIILGTAGCALMAMNPDDALFKNPSIHILVNEEASIPLEGTFSFDRKLFMVDYSEEMDLAAIDARIVDALADELSRKGYDRTASGADLLVNYAVAIDSEVSGSDLNEVYGDDFPIVVLEPDPDQQLSYHQGTLIVSFVDSKTHKLLWRGAIMAELSMDVSDTHKDQRARKGARLLLDQFPVPRAK